MMVRFSGFGVSKSLAVERRPFLLELIKTDIPKGFPEL
jgi:hypothetical protein